MEPLTRQDLLDINTLIHIAVQARGLEVAARAVELSAKLGRILQASEKANGDASDISKRERGRDRDQELHGK